MYIWVYGRHSGEREERKKGRKEGKNGIETGSVGSSFNWTVVSFLGFTLRTVL